MKEIFGTEVGQGMVLPVSPDIFRGIEFGRIGRETGQDHATALPFHEPLQLAAAVNRQAIPNDQQFPSHLAAQMGQEVQYLGRTDRSGTALTPLAPHLPMLPR